MNDKHLHFVSRIFGMVVILNCAMMWAAGNYGLLLASGFYVGEVLLFAPVLLEFIAQKDRVEAFSLPIYVTTLIWMWFSLIVSIALSLNFQEEVSLIVVNNLMDWLFAYLLVSIGYMLIVIVLWVLATTIWREKTEESVAEFERLEQLRKRTLL